MKENFRHSQAQREAGVKAQGGDSCLEPTGAAGQILPSRPREGTRPADTWILGLHQNGEKEASVGYRPVCHALLQQPCKLTHRTVFWRYSKSFWWYPTPCDPKDCSPPGSSTQGVLQAGRLEWVAEQQSSFNCCRVPRRVS